MTGHDGELRPPRAARFLLDRMKIYSESYEFYGDLEEEYNCILEREGKAGADRWYWWQAIASVPGYLGLVSFWWFTMFGSYLRATLRNMRRYRMYAALNIFGLVLGLSCCLTIFLFVHDEAGYDRFHENGDRIYKVYSKKDDSGRESGIYTGSYYPLAKLIESEAAGVELGTRYYEEDGVMLSVGTGKGIRCQAAFVDDHFFRIFSFSFARGDVLAPFSDRASVVLSASTAARLFGDAAATGATVLVNGEKELQVTGIIDDVPRQSSLKFDCALPFASLFGGRETPDHWGGNPLTTFVLLEGDSDRATVESTITGIVSVHNPPETVTESFFLQPLTRMHLFDPGGGGLIRILVILTVIALAVLLIACINFTNLNTARASTRMKEVIMRKILGANREDLVEQFFGEAMLITAFALVISVGVVSWILPVFNRILGTQLSIDALFTAPVMAGFIIITLVTGLASGAYPAACLSSIRTASIPGKSPGVISGNARLRKALVVIQFAISIFLMTATIAVYRQFDYIMSRDLGFDSERVLTVRMSQKLKNEFGVLKAELLAEPGIEIVSSSMQHPVDIGSTVSNTDWPGKDPDRRVIMHWDRVGYDFFETFGMEIARGRAFSEDFTGDVGSAYILNEEAVRQMGVESPVGMKFSAFGKEGTVVGVVRDFHFQPLYSRIKPFVFMLQPGSRSFLYARVAPDSPEAEASILELCRSHDPDGECEILHFDEIMKRYIYTNEIQIQEVAPYFTGFALLIACMGLLGLSAFMAEKRRKEISIRRVMGATLGEVTMLFFREFILWIGIAWALALPAVYLVLDRFLSVYAYHFDPEPMLFIIPGVAALVIALSAVGIQAMRIITVNPAIVLRNE